MSLTRVTPAEHMGQLQAPDAAQAAQVILRFLPLSLPIVSSCKSCLKLGLGESHRNRRNRYRSGESGSLEILPTWFSKWCVGGRRSRGRVSRWEPNLGSGKCQDKDLRGGPQEMLLSPCR